jgi:AraC-like DNA-binding protein
VGMSRAPFAARFTALVGHAPMSYLKTWRLQLAAKLLQNQALSLSNIAEQIGYESASAFSRIFKRSFGVAPGQFRRTAVTQLTSADTRQPAARDAYQSSREPRPKTISYGDESDPMRL